MAHILLRDLDIPDIWQFDTYVANGGYEGLKQAIGNHTPAEVIQIVLDANLRGRGGAGFPTGRKWSFIPQNEAVKYVVVNADESEPGTFKDRQLLEKNPHQVIEGAMIAAYAIQATAVYIYCRGEFWDLAHALEERIEEARQANLVGENVLGSGWNCPMFVHLGAGAYICGEESALLNSLQGLLGQPRVRPPFPAQKGYLGCPTTVNNVETFCCVARILDKGPGWFAQLGSQGSSGTKLLSISGDCKSPGVYEVPFGVKLREVLKMAGAEEALAVQVGGPSGQMVGEKDYDRSICYDDLATGGSVMVFGPQRNLLHVVSKFLEFFVEESCGYCTPCRVGNVLLKERVDRILAGQGEEADLAYLQDLGQTVKMASRCGLGQTSANPVLSTLKNFRSMYESLLRKPIDGKQLSFDIHQALADAQTVVGRQSVHF